MSVALVRSGWGSRQAGVGTVCHVGRGGRGSYRAACRWRRSGWSCHGGRHGGRHGGGQRCGSGSRQERRQCRAGWSLGLGRCRTLCRVHGSAMGGLVGREAGACRRGSTWKVARAGRYRVVLWTDMRSIVERRGSRAARRIPIPPAGTPCVKRAGSGHGNAARNGEGSHWRRAASVTTRSRRRQGTRRNSTKTRHHEPRLWPFPNCQRGAAASCCWVRIHSMFACSAVIFGPSVPQTARGSTDQIPPNVRFSIGGP